jgi:hypothetical protein
MKKMLLSLVSLGTIAVPITLAAGSLSILNNTKHSIDVNIQLPAYTQAVIELKKLPKNQLKLELLKAIHCDSGERVELAVAAGVDVNDEIGGVKPVIIAMSEAPNALKALVECGADLNISYEGYDFVTSSALIESLCFLVEYGVEFQQLLPFGARGYVDIMDRALCMNSFKLVKALVTAGYKINEISFSTLTLLLIAPNTEILKYLLQNGLNPNLVAHSIIEEEGSKTPIFAAIEQRNAEALKILLEASANPNLSIIRYGKTMTPISASIQSRLIEGVELLLKYGASL